MSFIEAVKAHYGGEKPTRAVTNGVTPGSASGYAAAALERECANVRHAAPGTINDTLNIAAFNLGQLVGGGHLIYSEVAEALFQAACSAYGGHIDGEGVPGTISSGLKAGEQQPRQIPERPAPAELAVTTIEGEHAEETHEEAVSRLFPLLDWHALWADDEPEEWIVEPLLPARRLVALYSAPKVGKSLLMLEIAAAIAMGKPALGVTPDRPRRVLYVDFENDPRSDVRERLQAMGLGPDDLTELCYLSFPTLAGLDCERGSVELMAAVEVYACEVVVVDTVSRAVDGEENENDTWLKFYRHTGLKLKQAGVALIRLDHSGKDETKGQRGGSAKVGDVDAVWRLSRVGDSDTTFSLTCEAHRMPIIERELTLTRTRDPHLRHKVEGNATAARLEAEEIDLLRWLDARGVPADAGRDAIRKALKEGGKRASNNAIGRVVKARKGVLYLPPKPVPDRWVSETTSDLSGTGADSEEN